MNEEPLRIVEMRVANVKRVVAVTVKPDGSLILIGGDNGHGKSSTLDAIMYALDGRSHPDEVLRRGEEKGLVRLDLGDLIVTRTFTKKGSYLTVKRPDGATYPAGQSVVSALFSKRGLDPLAFMQRRPQEQAEELRDLIGLDTSDLDTFRKNLYDERTGVNRDGLALRNRVEALPPLHEDAPDAERSSTEILDKIAEAEEANRANVGIRDAANRADDDFTRAVEATRASDAEVDRLQQEIKAAKANHTLNVKRAEEAQAIAEQGRIAAEALVDIDTAPMREALAGLEDENRKVRENAARGRLERELDAKRGDSAALTAKIAETDKQKADRIAAATFPVKGLGLNEDGVVTFNDYALAEASSAEQLRVSMAIALAQNPRLPVVLIRNGSLLDNQGRKIVAQMAQDAGAQVFMEVVGDDEDCSFVIEDGAVRGAEAGADEVAA